MNANAHEQEENSSCEDEQHHRVLEAEIAANKAALKHKNRAASTSAAYKRLVKGMDCDRSRALCWYAIIETVYETIIFVNSERQ